MLGNIVLHANATSHLDCFNNFAPEHQIRFDSLKYTADTRGDLVLTSLPASRKALKVPEWYALGPLADLASGLAPTLHSAMNPDVTDMSKNPESALVELAHSTIAPASRRHMTSASDDQESSLVGPTLLTPDPALSRGTSWAY